MKKSIIILGVLAVMFSNKTNANIVVKEQQSQELEFAKSELNTDSNLTTSSIAKDLIISKPEVELESTSNIIEAISAISTNYKKSIEEIIAEDKKITESKEELNYPLYFGRKIDEVIKEDNQIIESTISNEEFPLDFDLINKMSNQNEINEFKNNNLKRDLTKS